MDKSYRVHTNIINDTVLEVNMQQDFDFLEVLSLRLRQKDAYRLHSSNYGVIIGRVLANDAFGIPNAKVSVFIERDTNDTTEIEVIYPYSSVTSKDKDNRRYNLLPSYSDNDCYRVVGTFPNKTLTLDDDIQVEIYDKYWKYTTVTNNAGDYMIFGVPSGNVNLHIDIDLSDVGILSQKPRDFEYKGYDKTLFDSPNQFKESTNLDSLAQIITQDKSVFVYPFWGDSSNGIASLTRADVQIQYNFEPTCVFMGSIVSDNRSNAIGHRCSSDKNLGMNNQLVGGSGTIEMIRKTIDGLVEEYQINGNQLIDENGVWCYQIPMNLDYIATDEYGNIVPSDNPNKGIPTRARVRFRISKNETGDEGFSRHTAKYLVPMNPMFTESGTTSRYGIVPMISQSGADIENMYNFGSSTPESCFRDLYWNNVYSVKNYIPKIQTAHKAYSNENTSLKGSNFVDDQNPIPFNKLQIEVPFTYAFICSLVAIIKSIVEILNSAICLIQKILEIIGKLASGGGLFSFVSDFFGDIFDAIGLDFIGSIYHGVAGGFKSIGDLGKLVHCVALPTGFDDSNTEYYPGCWCTAYGKCQDDNENCRQVTGGQEYMDGAQRKFALEYKIIKLDFNQDWLNGCLYMPLWYWRKRKKKKFLFFTISRAKNEFCSCEKNYKLKTFTTCEIPYENNSLEVKNEIRDLEGEKKWHKNRAERVRFAKGLIKPVINKDDLTVYYYSAVQATANNPNNTMDMSARPSNFYAIRLYATDIILLGNLNEDNLYGIPQFFKCLPPSTANVPPMSLVNEIINDDEVELNAESETPILSDSGNTETIISGMDWGNNKHAKKDSPQFKKGLFLDLSCTKAYTKAKSCVNVERLSELGVALDMKYSSNYAHGGNELKTDSFFDIDGFISKLELDDMENRAMFATMNHIGFIPQSYQTSINSYETQVYDENTHYMVPKFKHIYPVDFDGRQQLFMDDLRNGFQQPLFDERDESYLTFRLGAEKDLDYRNNSEGRVRHFYKVPNSIDPNSTSTRSGLGTDDENYYHMPLYNNSFYFYFGIKKGSTAIDKFNEMFTAPCINNHKDAFGLTLTSNPRSYCPTAYVNATNTNGYGYIRVTSDTIKTPYSYELHDENDVIIIKESGMTVRDFVIGGYIGVDGLVHSNVNGKIYYQNGGSEIEIEPYKSSGLTNQTYKLILHDSEGKKLVETVTLYEPKINGNYRTTDLTSRFYNSAITRIDYICNEDNHYYGAIELTGFTVDGYDCVIDNIIGSGSSYDSENDRYVVCFSGHSNDVFESLNATLFISSIDKDNTQDCMCDCQNRIATAQTASDNMNISNTDNGRVYLGFDNSAHTISFFVYQPSSFNVTLTQCCNNCSSLTENSSSVILTVNNADSFKSYLNTMPLNFMLGTLNDSSAATISNSSNFYRTNPDRDAISGGIVGWYGTHQESTYMFSTNQNRAISANEMVWDEYVQLYDSITTPTSKRRVLQFKFNTMFSLSNATYVLKNDCNSFQLTSDGGRQPILIRNISPYYIDETKTFNTNGKYIFSDSNYANLNETYPNIVGFNSHNFNGSIGKPSFNTKYLNNGHDGYLGNYFASFTDNASYVSNNRIDNRINILRHPNFASISPYLMESSNRLKTLGRSEEISNIISEVPFVHTTGIQRIEGDNARRVNPWLRALYVDRRYDYDFTVIAPIVGNTFNLHGDGESERIWKSLRLSGFTYNGIEMSYDHERNIISADTTEDSNGDVISASSNNRLEYSYSYTDADEDCVTQYNNSENCVWDVSDYGYNASYDEDKNQLIKKPYANALGNLDLRNFYWSSFNRRRLSAYTTNQQHSIDSLEEPFYAFRYPMNYTSLYNGDFNLNSAISGNYPTVRYIDIVGVEPSTSYNFLNISCSYGTSATIGRDDKISAFATAGETTSFSLNFNMPIRFVAPSSANEEFGNIEFIKSGTSGDWKKFTANKVNINFNFNLVENSAFRIFTKVPKIIKVLPYTNQTDGISYIKTSNRGREFGKYGDGNNSLNDAINNVSIHEFQDIEIKLPKGVRINDDRMFTKDIGLTTFEMLNSNDNDFANIAFSSRDVNLNGAIAFTILVDREYRKIADDELTRHIRTVEFSDLYDARHVLLRERSDFSYVEVKKIETITTGVVDSVSAVTGETGGSISIDVGREDKPGEGMIYLQTLSFEIGFRRSGNPTEIENQSFGDYEMNGYIFEFIDSGNNKYFINCSDFVPIASSVGMTTVRFNIKWTQDMGILKDTKWGGQATVAMYAKTPSNFTYKLSNFTVVSTQSELPKNEGDHSQTNLTII